MQQDGISAQGNGSLTLAGKVVSVNISPGKGQKKQSTGRCLLREDYGIEGDGHAGTESRQVSLLAQESIEKIRAKGLDVGPGDFAENITTQGIVLHELSVGTKLKAGRSVLLEITRIGKVCHNRCAIFYAVGDCVMPREGIFARVLVGGELREGDGIEVMP
jgi:MOSC domain-containing protein YiiM